MQPSAMYRTLCEFFRLSDLQASGLRHALSDATWSEARAWAEAVQAFDLAPPHGPEKLELVVSFLQDVSPPARVVAVLEALHQEQLLTRREATQLEEHVFDCVDRQGRWFWDI